MAELKIKVSVDASEAKASLDSVGNAATAAKNKADSVGDSLADSFKAGGKVLGSIAAGVTAVVGLGTAIASAAAEGERHAAALQRLGTAYDQVTAATNGTVSAEEAVRVQQSLVSAGMDVTAEQLGVITRRAREYAQSTGVDMSQALEQVTQALQGLEAGGLRRFGATVDANASRSQNFANVIDQMRTSFRGVDPPARTLGEDMQHVRRGFTESLSAAAAWVAEATGLSTVVHEISAAFDVQVQATNRVTAATVASLSAIGRARANAQAALASAPVTVGPVVNDDVQQAGLSTSAVTSDIRERGSAALASARGVLGRRLRATDLNAQEIMALASAETGLASSRTDRSDRERSAAAELQASTLEQAAQRIALERATASVHAHTDAVRTHVQALRDAATERRIQREALREARAQGIAIEGPTRPHERSQRDQGWLVQQQAEIDARNALETTRRASRAREQEAMGAEVARENAAQQARLERIQALNQAERDQADLRVQLNQRFAQHAELTETRAQGMAGLVDGAYQTMTGALKSHISAVIQGKEDVGTALKGILQETLLNIATEASVKALLMAATGIAEMATPGGQAAGAAHLTSAAMFGAVALAAGAGYAGISALGNAAAAPAATPAAHSTAASTGGSSGGGGNGGVTNVVVNVNGFAMSHEGVQDSVAGALDGYLGRNRSLRNLRRAA